MKDEDVPYILFVYALHKVTALISEGKRIKYTYHYRMFKVCTQDKIVIMVKKGKFNYTIPYGPGDKNGAALLTKATEKLKRFQIRNGTVAIWVDDEGLVDDREVVRDGIATYKEWYSNFEED